jgi:hypothetical protein
MWHYREGFFASQGNTYSEAPLKRYLKPGSRLKYWEVIGLSALERQMILTSIARKLEEPWYKKQYDWLGIAGQAIGLTFINTPWLDYCSEDTPQHLKKLLIYMERDNPLWKVINDIPKHTSPADLNKYFKRHPEHFRVFGKWDGDDVF